MRATAGRPRSTGNLCDFNNPKLVIVDRCSRYTYWYSNWVGMMLIVCDSDDDEFGYTVLEKMINGKFANNGKHLRKHDVSIVCDVSDHLS